MVYFKIYYLIEGIPVKKRMTVMGTALLVVFGGLIAFNLIKGFMIKRFFANYEPPAITVSSVVAQKVDWEPAISTIGNFVAIKGVDVNAQASGNVVQVHFDSGQYIEQNGPLIDIDDTVDQATLKYNQAALTLRELNYQRQADLFKRGATPSSSVDEARANLQQAQAELEKVKAQIYHKHIVAPFSGLLGIRQINLGQFIKPGDTAIVTLQSLDPLYLEFSLPEQLLTRIHVNQAITFELDAFPNAEFRGTITAINSKVDTNTHNIKIQATVPNCPTSVLKQIQDKKVSIRCNSEENAKNKVRDFLFRPGMFASIEISQPPIPNTIILPSTAISYSLYGNSVFLIEKDKDGKKDDKGNPYLYVKRVFVTTGEQRGNNTVVTKGVKAGQLVVRSGEMKLQNDARVEINNTVDLKEINYKATMDQ